MKQIKTFSITFQIESDDEICLNCAIDSFAGGIAAISHSFAFTPFIDHDFRAGVVTAKTVALTLHGEKDGASPTPPNPNKEKMI